MSDPGGERERAERAYPGAPLWVKVFIAVILVLAVALVLSTVLGLHSPMLHGGEATPHSR